MNVTGRTTAGRAVVGGVFELVDRDGLPLELIFDRLREDRAVIDWAEFIGKAKRSGWAHGPLKRKILQVIGNESPGSAIDLSWVAS